MATTHNFSFSQMETWDIVASLRDADDNPLDLTGARVTWVVRERKSYSAAQAIDVNTVDGGVTITDAPNGSVRIVVQPNAASPVPAGVYWHECHVVLASGDYTVQFEGELTVLPSVVAAANLS